MKRLRLWQDVRLGARRAQAGFTMVEIAISIGVIGFALVAIIGILPRGMNVQKDNREETIVGQDGPYFLEAIRNGQQGLDFLTNYVEQINIKTNVTDPGTTYTSNNTTWKGSNIIALLSTMKYEPAGTTNIVTANVRALNGSAMMQNGANSLVAFRYLLTSELVSFQSFAPLTVFTNDIVASTPTNIDQAIRWNRFQEAQYLPGALYEVHLKFQWPILPNGLPGTAGIHYFRAMVSGQRATNANGLWFFQPRNYTKP